jgi:putative flippase GtrA
VKFVAIGIVNTIFGYLLYACVYLTTGNYRLATVIATGLGVIFNFFTTGRIVFGNTGSALIFRFIAGYAVSLTANLTLLERLTRAGTAALLAQVICLPPVVRSLW